MAVERGVRDGAEARDGDGRAGEGPAQAVQGLVHEGEGGPAARRREVGRAGEAAPKLARDLEGARRYAGAHEEGDGRGLREEGVLKDARPDPPPAGVQEGGAAPTDQGHRQAVGGQDREGRARVPGDDPVGGEARAGAGLVVEDDAGPVDLADPDHVEGGRREPRLEAKAPA